jgi:hypothetical protein
MALAHCRRSIVCVSKRWERLFFSEPSLWRSFQLAPASPAFPPGDDDDYQQQNELWTSWFEAQHRILSRVRHLWRRLWQASARAVAAT